MKDTRIVFTGITIILLLPIIFYGIRRIIKAKKEKDFRHLLYHLIAAGLACIAIVALFFSIYRFTIGYQAPLVAEEYLGREGYAYLKEMGFKDIGKSNAYLSENIYENDDGTVTIYAQFESASESIYTQINMKREGDRWQVIHHDIIHEDYDDHPELNKRFYPIEVKLK
ncbi:MAG: hypothetical protein GX375_07505 [Clostridiales bacterium]|nr:hypothetical protein [Clostridiales bacterium]